MVFRVVRVWFLIIFTILPSFLLEAQEISLDSLFRMADESYPTAPDSTLRFLTDAMVNYPSPSDQLFISEKIIRLKGRHGSEFQTFHELAKLYLTEGDLHTAALYGDTAQIIAMRGSSLVDRKDCFNTRHLISSKLGEAHKSLAYYKLFVRYSDSISRVAFRKKLQAGQDELAMAKQDAANKGVELEDQMKVFREERDRQWRYFLFMLAGILVFFFLFFLYRYRSRALASKLLSEKDTQLQELNSLSDRLFTVIGHDLRSPLSTYNNLTRSLAERMETLSKEEVRVYLRNLHASSVDLSRLLNNLLEWALIQTGSMPFNPEPFNCKSLAMEVAAQLRSSAEEKKLEIEFLIPDTQHAFGDNGMITIVWRTLLSNAIRFTSPGKSITLFSGRKDNLITLGVKDNGIGIDPEKLRKIFHQDVGAGQKKFSAQKVSGVGLQLCKDLISRNGGNFYAESKPKEGSTFYFSLPENGPT